MLPRDVSLFLIQFSIALSKARTYPAGHPARAGAIGRVVQRLRVVHQDRSALTIGVGRHHLLIEGLPTDPANSLLRELALRLHRHQLAALHLSAGIEAEEVAGLVTGLGEETWRQGRPLGLEPPAELERWPHVRLEPLDLEQLEIQAGGEAGQGRDLRGLSPWLSLAAVAISDWDTRPERSEPEPREVAQAIGRRRGDPAYDKIIAEYLARMSEAVLAGTAAETAALRERLAALVREIDSDVLVDLLRTGSDLTSQRKLLIQGVATLPVDAILKLLEAAGSATGQTISHAFLRLLHKLASHAAVEAPEPDFGADLALRDAARQLVSGWSLADPVPVSYRRILELLARAPAGPTQVAAENGTHSEDHRIVAMCLELGADVPSLRRAAHEMIEHRRLAELLRLLDQAGADPLVETVLAAIPIQLVVRRELLHPAPDFLSVERLVGRLGLDGAELMLDILEVSENLTVRRRLLSWLGRLGPELAPVVVARMHGKPWFVQRNALVLLRAIGVDALPPDFSPEAFAGHEDPRVRREAYKLLLGWPERAAAAITAALADDDPGVVRQGLLAALERCPPDALLPLLAGLEGEYRDPEVRLLAIRLLGQHRTLAARHWLLGRTGTKAGWFRRWRLSAKSAELLAVLHTLALTWGDDSEVKAVLRRAARSPDPDIRNAARGEGQ